MNSWFASSQHLLHVHCVTSKRAGDVFISLRAAAEAERQAPCILSQVDCRARRVKVGYPQTRR